MAQVILVHGAWGSPGMWGQVPEMLAQRDLTVRCAELPTVRSPSGTFAADVEHIRNLVSDEPVVLVGHSYGGVAITQAASDRSDVAHLVYIAAGMPDVGESMFDCLMRRPTDGLPLDFFEDGTSLPQQWGADDGRYPAEVQPLFDANPPRPFAVGAAVEPVTTATWKSIPSTYIVATRDRVLHPDTQGEFAMQRAGRSIEVDSDHVAMFVHPVPIADEIARAAS